MDNREKVIKEFELFIKEFHPACTSEGVELDMFREVLAMLKEQEPRVMTLSEIERSEECIVWFEDDQFNKNTPYNYAVVDGIDQRNGWVWLRTVSNTGSQQRRDYENYGKRWRCWTKRPTEDQRKATKWKC